MTLRKVNNIVDGDTFDIETPIVWNGNKYTRIRPREYNTPEKGEPLFESMKKKLAALILGKTVEIGQCYKEDRGRLLCDVKYNGKDLADYFPDYKK